MPARDDATYLRQAAERYFTDQRSGSVISVLEEDSSPDLAYLRERAEAFFNPTSPQAIETSARQQLRTVGGPGAVVAHDVGKAMLRFGARTAAGFLRLPEIKQGVQSAAMHLQEGIFEGASQATEAAVKKVTGRDIDTFDRTRDMAKTFRLKIGKAQHDLLEPSRHVAAWLKDQVEGPLAHGVEIEPTVAGQFKAMAKPEWWTNVAPEYTAEAGFSIVTGLGLIRALRWAGLTGKAAVKAGVAGAAGIGGAREAGASFAEMRDDLEAKGWQPWEAGEIAALGSMAYGIAAGAVERGILPGQLKHATGFREWFVKTMVNGFAGELTEEVAQHLLEGGTRAAIGLDPEVSPASITGQAIGGAFGGGIAVGATSAPSAFASPPEMAINLDELEAALEEALTEETETVTPEEAPTTDAVLEEIAEEQRIAATDSDLSGNVQEFAARLRGLTEYNGQPISRREQSMIDAIAQTRQEDPDALQPQEREGSRAGRGETVEPFATITPAQQRILDRYRQLEEQEARDRETLTPAQQRLVDRYRDLGEIDRLREESARSRDRTGQLSPETEDLIRRINEFAASQEAPDAVQLEQREDEGDREAQEEGQEQGEQQADEADRARQEAEADAITALAEDEGTEAQQLARQNVRRGMVDISGPIALAGAVGRGVTSPVRGFANIAVTDLIDRVGSIPGETDLPQTVAAHAREALNVARGHLGQFALEAKAVQKGASKTWHNVATWKLQGGETRRSASGASFYKEARIVRAVEDNLAEDEAPLSRGEQRIVDSLRALIDKTGQAFRDAGIQQFDHENNRWVDFNYIPGGKVYVRVQTPEMFSIIAKGPTTEGSLWATLRDSIADINEMDADAVDVILRRMRDDYNGAHEDRSSFMRMNAEFTRAFRRMPTHIRGGPLSTMIPIVETNPFMYARRLAENAASRLGFVDQFGQEIGNQALLQLRDAFAKDTGKTKPLTDLLRALNGMPVTEPLFDASAEMLMARRGAMSVASLLKSGMLTMTVVPNIFEPLGSIQAFSNVNALAKAFYELHRHPIASNQMLEETGAVTADVLNGIIDRSQPISSFIRALGEGMRKFSGRAYAEEFQGRMAAMIAYANTQEMVEGKGGAGNVIDLLMTIGPELQIETAQAMADGNGSIEQYQAYVRSAPAFQSGEAIRAAERTRASHNRIYRAWIMFELYAQVKMRQNLRLWQTGKKAFASKDPRLIAAFFQRAGRFWFGQAVAGTGSMFAMSLVNRGLFGMEMEWEKLKDEPLEWIIESWLYTMVAGPYGAVLRSLGQSSNRPMAEQLFRSTFPGFLGYEVTSMLNGADRYRDLPPWQRAGAFFERVVPANKAFATAVALWGDNKAGHEMDSAISAYWEWRFEEKPPGGHSPAKPVAFSEQEQRQIDQARETRRWMKAAYKKMRRLEPAHAELQQAFGSAVQSGDPATVARAIRSRKLLTGLTDDQKRALSDRVGERAYWMLVHFDARLEGLAQSYSGTGSNPLKIRTK